MGLWLIDEVIYETFKRFFGYFDSGDNNDWFNSCKFPRFRVYSRIHIEGNRMRKLYRILYNTLTMNYTYAMYIESVWLKVEKRQNENENAEKDV